MLDRGVAVIGGSLAGLSATEALRKEGYDGRLTLMGDEPELPYDRPPLSKHVLLGSRSIESTTLRGPDHFSALDVRVELGTAVTGIDTRSQQIELGERRLRFDGLIVATGASPRSIPDIARFSNVFLLRTCDDARALRRSLESHSRLVVVGAGVIGCEVAACARVVGLEVTIVEAASTAMLRSVGPAMGDMCANEHRRHGTDVRCGVAIQAVEGNGCVRGLRLTDGSVLEPEIVVVGIGVVPNTAWRERSGLKLANGILCDATLNTGHPLIYAAGDVARWPNPLFSEVMRGEQWTNAAEQGHHAARNLLRGRREARPFSGSNYFWSDQYENRLQFVGLPVADEVVVVDGAIEANRFICWYRQQERLVGALGTNDQRMVMMSKLLIERRCSWEEAMLRWKPGSLEENDATCL